MNDIEICLAWIRRPTSNQDEVVRRLRKLLQLQGKSLEDVGTSEQELKEQKNKSLLLIARQHYLYLSVGATSPNIEIRCMRGLLNTLGLGLEAIPTTEEELERLAKPLPVLPVVS